MKTKIKNILVTGGAGCIGLQVCKDLIERGFVVRLFDLPEQVARVKQHIPSKVKIEYGSILDCSSLRDAMVNCDAVIHLAAYLGVKRTETNKLRCLEININGTKNVLDCAVQHGVKKIIFASSSEVYGEPIENPITEESITQGKTVYAITKLAGEELCKAYTQRYPQLSHTILRYFNTYGPSQIAQFVIPKFIRNTMANKPPIIYGDGQQLRGYCYASDTAWATIEALLSNETNGEVFNVGNSDTLSSLIDLAETVIDVCGKKDTLQMKLEGNFANTDRDEEREIYKRYCDATKIKNLLGFVPKVSLEEGIKNVVEAGSPSPQWGATDLKYTLDEWL